MLVTDSEHTAYPVGQHLQSASCCYPAGNLLTTASFCNEMFKYQPIFSPFHHKVVSLIRTIYKGYNDGE